MVCFFQEINRLDLCSPRSANRESTNEESDTSEGGDGCVCKSTLCLWWSFGFRINSLEGKVSADKLRDSKKKKETRTLSSL